MSSPAAPPRPFRPDASPGLYTRGRLRRGCPGTAPPSRPTMLDSPATTAPSAAPMAARSARAQFRAPMYSPRLPPLATSRCDKGPPSSLLDSRWELDAATDERGKAAPFCIRPYRPIYLMPFFTLATESPAEFAIARQHRDRTRRHHPRRAQVPAQSEDQGARRHLRRQRRSVDGLHADLALADLQRPALATVPRDQLRARCQPRLPHRLRRARLEGAPARLRPRAPVQRSQRSALAQLEPGHGLGRTRERENWTITLRPWWRVLEFGDDNNPDISDYAGPR